ncbi:unnamed protein product [Amoebophrya sp. A25]|nr:unnamed protein product [Amoebophrya sp. A25]|eukprot:GSA25T00013657001.1
MMQQKGGPLKMNYPVMAPPAGKGGKGTRGQNPRPKSVYKYVPGDWICPTCEDLQFRRNQSCRICGTMNPMVLAQELAIAAGKSLSGMPFAQASKETVMSMKGLEEMHKGKGKGMPGSGDVSVHSIGSAPGVTSGKFNPNVPAPPLATSTPYLAGQSGPQPFDVMPPNVSMPQQPLSAGGAPYNFGNPMLLASPDYLPPPGFAHPNVLAAALQHPFPMVQPSMQPTVPGSLYPYGTDLSDGLLGPLVFHLDDGRQREMDQSGPFLGSYSGY